MGRFNKKYILIIMLLGIFLLAGCSLNPLNASKEDNSSNVTAVPDDSQNNTDTSDKVTPTAVPSGSNTSSVPATDKELQIYTVDAQSGSGDIIPVTALIPQNSKITPDLIVDKVVESLADQSIKVGIENVTLEKDAVIVNFNKNETPYKNTGSEYEANILNAFAQSLIDNLPDYNKVIFRVDGKAYNSGSLEYDLNEPYMEK